MLQALQSLQNKYLFDIAVVDVDTDSALIAQFDELVPVLTARRGNAEPVQLCHYFLDEIKVEAFLLRDTPC